MSQNIIIELTNILSELLQVMELFFLNFSPGFNYFTGALFFVSIIGLMFWIVAKSGAFVVVGTK